MSHQSDPKQATPPTATDPLVAALAMRARRAAEPVAAGMTDGHPHPPVPRHAAAVEVDALLAAQADLNRDTAEALALVVRRLDSLERRLGELESTSPDRGRELPAAGVNGNGRHDVNGKGGAR